MVRARTFSAMVVALLVLGFSSTSYGRSDRIKGVRPFDSDAETVDLFKAVEEGTLSVKVIPRDSKECRVLITNKSSRDVNIRMPAALAAVPVLAQIDINGLNQSSSSSTTPQRLGVGNPFGQSGLPQMGMNLQGGPMMNPGNQPFFAPFCVAPEKVAQLRLPSVCLDHGHPDPRPAMRYQLLPLNEVSDSKELEMLCRQLAYDPTMQRVAQAVAWHLSNGKTWEEMGAMMVRRLGRPDQFFFARSEIKAAKTMASGLEKAVSQGRETRVASSQ